jgi:hypothetical protein
MLVSASPPYPEQAELGLDTIGSNTKPRTTTTTSFRAAPLSNLFISLRAGPGNAAGITEMSSTIRNPHHFEFNIQRTASAPPPKDRFFIL